MQPPFLFFFLVSIFNILPTFVSAFYYKRTTYGDANNNEQNLDFSPDYVNAYYGFPAYPRPQENRRRPPFGLYPPQNFFRREHPFDFGPMGHRIGDTNEQATQLPMRKTDRERVMEKARPGFWKLNGRGEGDSAAARVKKIINEKRMDMAEKHMQLRKALANERDEMRSKFADLHKRLVEKNFKMVARFVPKNVASSNNSSPLLPSPSTAPDAEITSSSAVPELSKQAKKIEKEAKKIMENKKMTIEAKQEKLDKLMLKAPENVKDELKAINDSNAVPSALPLVQYPSQQSLSVSPPSASSLSIVESRPIRISEDGQTVEI